MNVKITISAITSLKPNETIWDSTVVGFGARRQRSPSVSYVLMYRTQHGRSRLYTIGRHGSPWTPDTARKEAVRLLGEVVQGRDPALAKRERRHALTVAELCDRYLADATSGRLLTRQGQSKRQSTLAKDRGRIALHIKPALGRLPVAAVTRRDVERFMHDVAAGKTSRHAGNGAAARSVNLLGAIFTFAVRQGLCPANPVLGVVRPADVHKTRRLSDLEYRQLGEAIRVRTDSKDWPPAVAAVRLLAVTGWRSGEVLGLRWSEIDLDRRTAHLSETKTGASMRPVALSATAIIRGMEPFRAMSPDGLVFPAERTARAMVAGFTKLWARLGLPSDITPHTLRHSFASLAGDLGFSEVVIAALLGHRLGSMTSRYVHSADAVLLAAADRVAEETLRRMTAGTPQPTVLRQTLVS